MKLFKLLKFNKTPDTAPDLAKSCHTEHMIEMVDYNRYALYFEMLTSFATLEIKVETQIINGRFVEDKEDVKNYMLDLSFNPYAFMFRAQTIDGSEISIQRKHILMVKFLREEFLETVKLPRPTVLTIRG